MSQYIALLRGINVGKTKRMAMADLRELLVGLGYGDVKTLLQSGNAIFTSAAKADGVERRIQRGIQDRFGFDVAVIVRTVRELRAIVDQNPLPKGPREASKFHVGFLSAKPKPSAIRGIEPSAFAPEQFAIVGREIYLWCCNGVHESKLFTVFNDKRLEVAMTARNWNTVTKLLALVGGPSERR